MKLKSFLKGFGFIAILLTLMPFIAVDYWWIRMFDFPHLQLTLLTAFSIVLFLIKIDFKSYRDYIFISCLLICVVYQFSKIYPYTSFSDLRVQNASKNSSKELSFFTCNVLQHNEAYKKVIEEMTSYDADVILFTETNLKWKEEITKSLSDNYKFKVEYPLDNTYGMLLYSKYELINSEIKFLVSDTIPSIHTKLKLPFGQLIQIYAIHPTPPMPGENPMSSDRDAEMMKIALKSRENSLPVVAIGDFNDVAWSQSSKLFNRLSGLLDLRKGRGLFNTYNAQSYILRWPLDHIFISNEFRVKELEIGKNVSSDHFPLYAKLTFEPELADEQKSFPLLKEDLESAKEQIQKEKIRNKK